MVPSIEDVQQKYNAKRGNEVVDQSSPLPFSVSVEGLEASGKSHFAIATCPLPLVHLNFGDRSATPLLYDVSPERRSQITLYETQATSPQGWTREEGRASLQMLVDIANAHLANGAMKGGTFCLDSGTSWWQVIQEVYVAPEQEKRETAGGKKTGGLEYSQANLIVSGVLQWIKSQGVFLIITHQKAQDWDKHGPILGSYSPRLNRKVPYLVEVRLDLQKRCANCGSLECRAAGHIGRRHMGRIIKFGKNTALEGFEMEGPTFQQLYALYAGQEFPNKEALIP